MLWTYQSCTSARPLIKAILPYSPHRSVFLASRICLSEPKIRHHGPLRTLSPSSTEQPAIEFHSEVEFFQRPGWTSTHPESNSFLALWHRRNLYICSSED